MKNTQVYDKNNYRMRAIITRGLYILNPLFEDQKRFFKEVFQENSIFMYGQYSIAVSNQERVMMARVRCMITDKNTIDRNKVIK